VAIGRLGSFKTSTTVGLNTNTVLYTSTGTLSNVTINVTNQGTEDAVFSIGISSGTAFRDSDVIIYGQTIEKNTYASITNVGICSGETIFVRANKANISFIANSVVDYDASIGTFFGRQDSVRTSLSGPVFVNTPVVLYTAPKAAQVSISVNNTSPHNSRYSIGISSGGLLEFTSADYIIFGQSLPKRTTQIIDSIGIGTGQSIIVRANESGITFAAYDLPTSVLEKIIVTDAISIGSSVTAFGGFYGNLVGIATYATNSGIATYATNSGIATYATNSGIATYATNSGIASALISTVNINTTGIITASKYIVSIGSSNQFLKADGSLDTTTYLTAATVGGTPDNVGGQVVLRSGTGGFSAGIVTTTSLNVNGDARITGILTVGTGSITLNGSTNNITGVSSVSDASGGYLSNPPGTVITVAASTAPAGFLKANGASLNTTTYATLFAAIGYTFGGSGASFTLPDLRGEFIRGWDDARTVDTGRTFGSSQAEMINQHRHWVSSASIDDRNFTGSGGNTQDLGLVSDAGGYSATDPNSGAGRFTRNDPGFGVNNETRPRNIALLYCIKY
jgi:hypothetical protein